LRPDGPTSRAADQPSAAVSRRKPNCWSSTISSRFPSRSPTICGPRCGTLRGFCEMFVEDFGSSAPADGEVLLDRRRESGARMSQLIEDLLAFARFSRQPLQKLPVSLGEIARRLIGTFGRRKTGRSKCACKMCRSAMGMRRCLSRFWLTCCRTRSSSRAGGSPRGSRLACRGRARRSISRSGPSSGIR
jgi:hypothetical protein